VASVRIGLISDTHGLLRPEALSFLAGSDHIIHAGDIVGAAMLAELAHIAPVTAVRGNNDNGAWAEALREVERIELGGVKICVVHDIADYRSAFGDRVVVTGHSHVPRIREEAGVLFVNPGSAGPRRFKLPIAVAELLIDGLAVTARVVELDA